MRTYTPFVLVYDERATLLPPPLRTHSSLRLLNNSAPDSVDCPIVDQPAVLVITPLY